MYNSDYILYLNTLHNFHAQNSNSYGEKNVKNAYFKEVMVEVGLSKYIVNSLQTSNPHTLILTGHAGDGKTSIMYQVLKLLDIEFDPDEKIRDYLLPSGRKCRCIKDFSEISASEKQTVLNEALNMSINGDYVFMVANTGPLINTFGDLFEDTSDSERAKIELIDAMDSNTGDIVDIKGYKLSVINVAAVDNTYFASEFLKKLIGENLWSKCSKCTKKEFCHIKKNRDLISEHFQRVSEFLNMHYVWITEHGKRLTIRSMTEQLAYMITGGFNCADIYSDDIYKYLFSNLFFGYVGTLENAKAHSITAVKEAAVCSYYNKRLRSDETYILNPGMNKVFSKSMFQIIKAAEINNAVLDGWNESLRRAYFFTNIDTDPVVTTNNYEDIFSKLFLRYLKLRSNEDKPSRLDANLICDALSMIYIGTSDNSQMIPLTLSRESGITQNVQLSIGSIMTKNVKIVLRPTKDGKFNGNNNRYVLKLEIEKKELNSEITLPLLNYFEELKNGIISTNVDPQLSHGIESLKAEISELMDDSDDELFEMIILRNSGTKTVRLEITSDRRICEM